MVVVTILSVHSAPARKAFDKYEPVCFCYAVLCFITVWHVPKLVVGLDDSCIRHDIVLDLFHRCRGYVMGRARLGIVVVVVV
jgi:hypothetical protein